MADKLHSEFDALPDVRDSKELHSEFDSLAPAAPAKPGILENAGQTASDLARGAGQGLSFGFSDEAMGGAQALKDIISDPSKAQDFLKLYRQHQQEEQTANEAAAKRSPIAYNIGDYGSTLASGLLTGGGSLAGRVGAKGLAQLALKGGLTGGAQALGRSTNTIEGNPQGLASDVTTGTTAGAILGPILGKTFEKAPGSAVSAEMKAINQAEQGAITQSPMKSQIAEAFNAGKIGQGYNKSKDVVSREAAKEQSSISGIKNVFDDAETKLLKDKKELLDTATSVLKPEPEKISQIPSFLDFASKSGEVSKRDLQEVAQVLEQYSQGGLSPKAADAARRKIQQMASTVQDPNVRGSLNGVADELESGIEKTVPGYGDINSQIHQFLKSGRETLLSRGKDPQVSRIQIGGLAKEDLKTESELGRILGSLRNYTPNTTKESQGAVDKTMASLSNLFEENPDLAKKLGINLPGLEKQIYNAADQTAVANKLIPGALGDLKPGSGMLGIPQFGEKGLLKGANLAGQATKKSSDLYRLTKDGLVNTAQQLQNSGVPGLSSVGEGLAKALESGDQHKTNATLFTILQNPTARKFLGYSPENQSKGDNFGQ